MLDIAQAQALYDVARKWFAIVPPLQVPITFFIGAPFGRFAPENESIFLVDGIKAWIAMELVAPIAFTYTYLQSPLSPTHSIPPLTLSTPATLLAAFFLLHYLNRSLVSPLRSPARSKSHIIVPLFAIVFNVVNGCLMGTYLSSPGAQTFLAEAFARPLFWLGVGMWAAGLAGNVLHDEVLLDIRRKAKAKGKARESIGDGKNKQEYYAIPHGYLYSLISYPNYFCEWCEWLGFALAAAPLPSFASGTALMATLSPPYLFFLSELSVMLPRAYRGHQWYRSRFPDYPKERKAVIPFLF
ncbi:3-oxo-5-alpha-steroid 4-dehydrogenase-domain-containing protein [Sparassis latifolia]